MGQWCNLTTWIQFSALTNPALLFVIHGSFICLEIKKTIINPLGNQPTMSFVSHDLTMPTICERNSQILHGNNSVRVRIFFIIIIIIILSLIHI